MSEKSSARSSDKGDDSASNFGVSNLKRRQALAEKYYSAEVSVDNATEISATLFKTLQHDVPNAIKAMKRRLAPGFIKRFNAKKVHIKDIEESEE